MTGCRLPPVLAGWWTNHWGPTTDGTSSSTCWMMNKSLRTNYWRDFLQYLLDDEQITEDQLMTGLSPVLAIWWTNHWGPTTDGTSSSTCWMMNKSLRTNYWRHLKASTAQHPKRTFFNTVTIHYQQIIQYQWMDMAELTFSILLTQRWTSTTVIHQSVRRLTCQNSQVVLQPPTVQNNKTINKGSVTNATGTVR